MKFFCRLIKLPQPTLAIMTVMVLACFRVSAAMMSL